MAFFQRLFSTSFSSDVAIWWINLLDFFFPRRYSSPCTYRSSFPLPQDFLDVIFFCRGLVYSIGHQKTFFSMTNQKLFSFSYAWRRLVMSEKDSWCLNKPDEAFHTTRHRPWRLHQEFRLVAPRKPIWLSHTHFAWQTKLWLSEDVSVRFNQNWLKQCIRKYYIRFSG